MHDAATAEKIGRPAVGLMTTAFVDAAEIMSIVCGLPGYRFAVIEHPLSSASKESRDLSARSAVQQLRDVLTGTAIESTP